MRKFGLWIGLAFLMIVSPAYGQSKKELAAQNAALAERITVLENRLLTGDPAAERLMQRIDALEASQRILTGELERVQFERDKLESEVEALKGDIRILEQLATRTEKHLNEADLLEQARRSVPPQYLYEDVSSMLDNGDQSSQISSVPGAPDFKEQTIDVQTEYASVSKFPTEGKRKMAEGDFAGAQQAFNQYLTLIPKADDAGEINYWLGETHYVQGSYADAADAYIQSMRVDPKGTKGPESMIGLAMALRELGQKPQACKTLNSFALQYPNASASVQNKLRIETARTEC